MTDNTLPVLTTRNATLADLAELLRDQQSRKVDVVAHAAAVHARAGRLIIDGTEPKLTPGGVGMTRGVYTPTEVCDQGLADKLGIPATYLRRLRTEHTDLYDANINGWLTRSEKRYLIRGLRGDDGGGVARAFLSDGYKIIDNPRCSDGRARRHSPGWRPGHHRRVRPDSTADVRAGRQ